MDAQEKQALEEAVNLWNEFDSQMIAAMKCDNKDDFGSFMRMSIIVEVEALSSRLAEMGKNATSFQVRKYCAARAMNVRIFTQVMEQEARDALQWVALEKQKASDDDTP